MSVKKNEELNYANLTGTYKQLYCAICQCYVCNNHNIREENQINFDNPEVYKLENVLYTFKSLIYISYISYYILEVSHSSNLDDSISDFKKVIDKENNNINKTIENNKINPASINESHNLSIINNINLNFFDKINNLIFHYNEIVMKNKISRKFPIIDIKENLLLSKSNSLNNISQINNNVNSGNIKY